MDPEKIIGGLSKELTSALKAMSKAKDVIVKKTTEFKLNTSLYELKGVSHENCRRFLQSPKR